MMITIMPWSLRKPVLLTLLITVTPTSFAADLFRWVDKKGNVHYTDRVPPEYVQNGYRVINQQGLTITTISAKKDEPDQKVSAEARAQLERDRRLLTIYSNADEINTTRDRKLAEIKNGISMRQDTLTLLERQFREQTREAGDYEKQNEAVPATLIANINTTKKKSAPTKMQSNSSSNCYSTPTSSMVRSWNVIKRFHKRSSRVHLPTKCMKPGPL